MSFGHGSETPDRNSKASFTDSTLFLSRKSLSRKLHVLTNLKTVLTDEEGATLVEYSLVVGLIAIACIATLTALGGQVNTGYTAIKTKLAAA